MSGETDLPPELMERLQVFVSRYGEAALDAALDAGHLFSTNQRALSRLAIKHSSDYAEAGLPHALVIKIDPNAKTEANRVESRLVTGRVNLALDFGTVGA